MQNPSGNCPQHLPNPNQRLEATSEAYADMQTIYIKWGEPRRDMYCIIKRKNLLERSTLSARQHIHIEHTFYHAVKNAVGLTIGLMVVCCGQV